MYCICSNRTVKEVVIDPEIELRHRVEPLFLSSFYRQISYISFTLLPWAIISLAILLNTPLSSSMTVPISHQPIDTPPRALSPVHGFGTLAVHAGSPHDPVTGAVIESVCYKAPLSNWCLTRCRSHCPRPLLKHQLVIQLVNMNTQEVPIPTGSCIPVLLRLWC